MNICVIGAGHVGLVTGACFAEIGHTVICVDSNSEKIAQIKNGIMPIFEPGLEELVEKGKNNGRLLFTDRIGNGVKKSDIIFLAVGTPQRADGRADLSAVEEVCKNIADTMNGYKIIVEKSTVPVKTGDWVKQTLQSNINSVDFDVASNPEFLKEGSAIKDFMEPDRIVIGVENEKTGKVLQKLYEPLSAPIVITDIKSSEIIKHASNSFLALKISYINAIATICELAEADVEKVAEGMGLDKRIGKSFLKAGVGYGGSCFPKDISAFIDITGNLGYDFQLLKSVQNINTDQKDRFLRKLQDVLWTLNKKTVGILGLSFKPDTDDMREAPSIYIIKKLEEEGVNIKTYDPAAMDNAAKIFKNIKYCADAYETSEGCDALIILTEWEEFSRLDLEKLKEKMAHPVIVDGRNIFEPAKMEQLGFTYVCMGR